MNLKELNNQYPGGELSEWKGHGELKYKVLSPVFQNLYQNKVVYHENFTSIVVLKDIVITPEKIQATARHHLTISRGRMAGHFSIPLSWQFSAMWQYVFITGNILSTDVIWCIWTDPELVKKVEDLVLEERYEEAMKITVLEDI